MLNKTQIRFLKSQAHHLNPVVTIGGNGLTENVHKEINLALDSHELIKVKLGQLADEKQNEIIQIITQLQHANFVQKIGHVAIFYRENPTQKIYNLPK